MKTLTEKELRELDAWIAEHVMGFRRRQSPNSIRFEEIELPLDDGSTKWCNLNMIQNYSTNPAAAMQVLEKCAEKLAPQRLHIYAPTGACKIWLVSDCEGHNSIPSSGSAEKLTAAICLFAQKLFSK